MWELSRTSWLIFCSDRLYQPTPPKHLCRQQKSNNIAQWVDNQLSSFITRIAGIGKMTQQLIEAEVRHYAPPEQLVVWKDKKLNSKGVLIAFLIYKIR